MSLKDFDHDFDLRCNADFMIEVLKNDGMILQYVDDALKDDYEVVQFAVK